MKKPVSTQARPPAAPAGPMPAGDKDKQNLLRQRAARLARREDANGQPGTVLDLVEFRLAQERYAVEAVHVREVYPLRQLTTVPCTPAFVLGIINIRGRIISVVDLKKFFDLPGQSLGDLNKAIVLRSAEMEMGILADRVAGTLRLATEQLEPALPTLTGIREDYLKGIGPGQLVVLDAARILADRKLVIQETVSA